MFLFKRDGFYHIEYFDEAERKTKRKSTRTKSKSEAMKALIDFKKRNVAKTTDVSIKQFELEYISYLERTNHSIKYLTSAKLSLKQLKLSLTPDTLLKTISERHLENFLTEKYSTKAHAAHLYYRTLKAAFNKAIAWNYLYENPLKRIKLPKVPSRFPLFLTKVDFNTLLGIVPNAVHRDIFQTAYYTGMRLSEILHIQWDAIDLNNRLIKVMNTSEFTTKSKKERVIPINDILCELLTRRKLQCSHYLVFNSDGNLYNDTYISKRFKKAVIGAGLNPKLHFHSLRHSFASNLAQNGVSLYIVKELLGHESITTTEIYAHLQRNALVDAVRTLI